MDWARSRESEPIICNYRIAGEQPLAQSTERACQLNFGSVSSALLMSKFSCHYLIRHNPDCMSISTSDDLLLILNKI